MCYSQEKIDEKVFFSIIIPTYNRSSFLTKSIKSVIAQTYKNWEIIIIDDGSTDDTKLVFNRLSEIDDRIRYVFQENQERSAARNNGISESIGNWITFLDSDDIYHPGHLEEFVKIIRKNNFCEGLYFSGISANSYDNTLQEYNTDSLNDIEFVLLNTFATPQACVAKNIFRKHSFNENITNGEDRELWVRILEENKLFYHKNRTIIQINHSERSVNLGSEFESLKTLKYIIRENLQKLSRKAIKTIISNAYFRIAKNYIFKKQFLKAIFYLVLSLIKSSENEQTRHKIALILSILNLKKKNLLNEYTNK